MKNNKNNFSKRTENQVQAILIRNGINKKAYNEGDGNLFSVNGTDIKTRYAIRRAGFILERSCMGDNTLYFRCH